MPEVRLWDIFAVIGAFFCGLVLIMSLQMAVDSSLSAAVNRAENAAQDAIERVEIVEQRVSEHDAKFDELYQLYLRSFTSGTNAAIGLP